MTVSIRPSARSQTAGPLPWAPPHPGEVHVWTASVREHAPRANVFAALLDERESALARRLEFSADRTRYVVAHGLLRLVLGACAGCAPSGLMFAFGAAGKPSLRPADGSTPLEFNLSHAGDRVLIALAQRAVGVDVERCSDRVACEEVALHVFSLAERRRLEAVEPARKRAAFFAAWTRKEAYVKATGTGLGYDDRACEVVAQGPWSSVELDVGDGYAAAVVAAGSGWHARAFALTPALVEQVLA